MDNTPKPTNPLQPTATPFGASAPAPQPGQPTQPVQPMQPPQASQPTPSNPFNNAPQFQPMQPSRPAPGMSGTPGMPAGDPGSMPNPLANGGGTSYNLPTKKPGSPKAIIFGAVAIIVVIMAALVIYLVMTAGKINSPEQFVKAVKDAKAVNCQLTDKDGSKTTIQANDGWTKVRQQAADDDKTANILVLKDDNAYVWYDGESEGYAMGKDEVNEYLKTVKDEADKLSGSELKVEDGAKFECEKNDKATFDKPDGVKFTDMSKYLNNSSLYE